MRGGISQTINDLFQSLGISLPNWAGIVIIVVVLILFYPFFVKNARTQKARIIWKGSFFEPKDKRMLQQKEAMALVEGNISGQLSLVELALHNNQLQLAEDTLRTIRPARKHKKEIRRLLFRIEQKAARNQS